MLESPGLSTILPEVNRTEAHVKKRRTVLFAVLVAGLVCSSCHKGPEPIEFVVELAETHRDLLDGLKVALDYSESDLYAATSDYEETSFWSGQLEGTELDGLEGISTLSGQGRYVRESDVFRDVYWTLTLEYEGLDVSGEIVSGDTSFDVQEHLFESSFEYHDLAGTLEWNGVSHEVDYSARFTANTNLQELTATFDGEELNWETEDPDEP